MRILVALLSGLVFGLGLMLSDMVNPARVLAFLDLFGDWDITLAFVMAGGLAVSAGAWAVAGNLEAPAFGGVLPGAPKGAIDAKLIGGAALFGLGWGLVGVCPGPALTGLLIGGWPITLFVAAMLAGMFAHDALIAPRLAKAI